MVEMGDALRAEERPEEPPAAVSYFTTHTVIFREGDDAPSPPAGEEVVAVSAADVEAAVAAVVNAAEAVPTTPTRSRVEENAVAVVQDLGDAGGGDDRGDGDGYGGIAEGADSGVAKANDVALWNISWANRETDAFVAAAAVNSSAESLPKPAGVEAAVGGDSTAEATVAGVEAEGEAQPPVLVSAQAPGKPLPSPMQQKASVAATESAPQKHPSNDERLPNSKNKKKKQVGTGAGRAPDNVGTAGGPTRASSIEFPPAVAARATAGKRPRSPTTAEADERATPSSPPAPPVPILPLGGETVASDQGTAARAGALTAGGVDGVCPGLIVWAPRGDGGCVDENKRIFLGNKRTLRQRVQCRLVINLTLNMNDLLLFFVFSSDGIEFTVVCSNNVRNDPVPTSKYH